MGFDKFPHSPQLTEFAKKKAGEALTQFFNREKGSPPTKGGLLADDLRKKFSHTYSAYVIKLGGWLRSKQEKSEIVAMEMTYVVLMKTNPIVGWQAKRWVLNNHHACLVYPSPVKQAEFDKQRKELGLNARTDPYHDGYVFDPWYDQTPAVYLSQGWCQFFGGNGTRVAGQEYVP